MKRLTVLCAGLLCAAIAPAFAATTTCTGPMNGLISGSLNVPAGATCTLNGAEVTGTVTVQGVLHSYGTRFDGNVNVTGGVIIIGNGNGMGSALLGNLSITASSGNNQIGCPNISNEILGNLTFEQNSGNLYVCQANVGKNVSVNNNIRVNNDYSGPYVADLNGIKANNFSCGGNVSSNGDVAIKGSGNTAAQKNGQCAGI